MTKKEKKIVTQYFKLDMEKFKENPQENIILVLEAMELTFSNNAINFDKLVPILKIDDPILID